MGEIRIKFCWAWEKEDEPCWGDMGCSEDYPGQYTYFCEGHGHFEDEEPYQHEGNTNGL